MSDPQALAGRLEAVETALAHQQRVVEDLEQVVRDQWKQIDHLTRLASGLADRLGEAENRLRQVGPAEPPPPHW